MLGRSRVTGSLDVGRVAEAVSRPGIDPRTWVSLAVVDAVRVDKDLGIVCDVTLMPGEQTEVARVGTEYAGAGWGAFFPVYPDDEVLVAAPGGDPNAGLVIFRRLHSPSAELPQEAADNPDDAVVVVKPGQSLRLVTSGGGDVRITGDGKVVIISGDVRLGGDDAADALILSSIYRPKEDALLASVVKVLADLGKFANTWKSQSPFGTGSSPEPNLAAIDTDTTGTVVAAGQPLAGTYQDFITSAATFLSGVSKTK